MFFVYSIGIDKGLSKHKFEIRELNKTLKTFNTTTSNIDSNILSNLALQEERTVSLNKRFDDLYVLGGIILTLMFILVASVYIKSEKDVKSHLDQNFEVHKDEIQLKLDKANSLLTEIETLRDLATQANASIPNGANRNGVIE
jgi:hypothetical protein